MNRTLHYRHLHPDRPILHRKQGQGPLSEDRIEELLIDHAFRLGPLRIDIGALLIALTY